MAGGPDAWPEPISEPVPEMPAPFFWTGVFPNLEVIVESGDPLTVFGERRDLEMFAGFFSEHLCRSIQASSIVSYERLTVPHEMLFWIQTAPDAWRLPGGKVIMYTPDGRQLYAQTSDEAQVALLQRAGAQKSTDT